MRSPTKSLTDQQSEDIQTNLEYASERHPIRWDVYIRDIRLLTEITTSHVRYSTLLLSMLDDAAKARSVLMYKELYPEAERNN